MTDTTSIYQEDSIRAIANEILNEIPYKHGNAIIKLANGFFDALNSIESLTTENTRLEGELVKAKKEIDWQADIMIETKQRADQLQARVDALMWEYCPDEMTEEQRAEYAKNQKPVDYRICPMCHGEPGGDCTFCKNSGYVGLDDTGRE